MKTKPNHRTDVVAVLFLVAAALVVAWPILTGGYLTYADNAAHIAEIYALAFEDGGGWSDIAFCGFPIGTLHSPLWYGGVAALVRAGVPAGFLYAFALFIGFIAPPLALYFVARRYLRSLTAGFLAYLLLVQRPSLVGLGTPLAGMWTYYIAAALFIALVWRLGRETAVRARFRMAGDARRAYRDHAPFSRGARRDRRRGSSRPVGGAARPAGDARIPVPLRARRDRRRRRVLATDGARVG